MLFEGNMSIPEPSTWEESTVAGPSSMGRKVARTPATGPDVKARGLDTAGIPGTPNSNGLLSHLKMGVYPIENGGLMSDFHEIEHLKILKDIPVYHGIPSISKTLTHQRPQGDPRAQHRPVFVCEGSEAQCLTGADLHQR